MKYKIHTDGEWVHPKLKGYKLMCCDCGLVHKITFNILCKGNGRHSLIYRPVRDERATAATRRSKKYHSLKDQLNEKR